MHDNQRRCHFNSYADRDREATELKRRLSLARAARNKPEIRRIEKRLKFWGVPA